jgi:hypothetical protein
MVTRNSTSIRSAALPLERKPMQPVRSISRSFRIGLPRRDFALRVNIIAYAPDEKPLVVLAASQASQPSDNRSCFVRQRVIPSQPNGAGRGLSSLSSFRADHKLGSATLSLV